MSSTSNNNTCGNYNLQQRNYTLARDYSSYYYSQYGHAYTPAIPLMGITPSHMPWNTLSNNPVAIETALFGINSVNLVDPQPPTVPELKHVPSVAFFPRMPLLMPRPLEMHNHQRPFPIPE